MSEAKTRTITDVQNEYSQLCAKAGHLQYQMNAFNKDLETINGALRDLNLEAAKLSNAAQPAPAETAAPNA